MTPAKNETNRLYWLEHNYRYPFRATAPVGQPKPHQYGERKFDVLVVPFDDAAHWGFETRDDMDRFLSVYPNAKEIRE